MSFTVFLALAVAAMVVLIALRFLWTFRYRTSPITDPHELETHNVVKEGRELAYIFTGIMHKEVYDNDGLAAAIRSATYPIQILFGPGVDVEAVAILQAAKANPLVDLFHVRREAEIEVYDPATDQWRFPHFAVVDGRHLCKEAIHGRYPKLSEFHMVEEHFAYYHAERLERHFTQLRDQVGLKVDKGRVVAHVRRHGSFVHEDEDCEAGYRVAIVEEIEKLTQCLGEQDERERSAA